MKSESKLDLFLMDSNLFKDPVPETPDRDDSFARAIVVSPHALKLSVRPGQSWRYPGLGTFRGLGACDIIRAEQLRALDTAAGIA